MMDDDEERPEYVTTEAIVRSYNATQPIFSGLLAEIRELSKKKPEATMSPGKVKIINRVLVDLLVFLKTQPEGKYLEELDDKSLPQVSDALLVMVQFKTALSAFLSRHRATDRGGYNSYWVTEELLAGEAEQYAEDEDELDEDDESAS
jgi:hypothetical protein